MLEGSEEQVPPPLHLPHFPRRPPPRISRHPPQSDTQHFLGQINLQIDGDEATGEVYFQAYHKHATEGFDRFICGRYIDRYRRVNGSWRMSHRTEAVDWTRTEPIADDYLRLRPHTVRGTRDTTDLSYRPHEA